MEKRRAPKLRFQGFTDDWEQRKLRDLVKEIKRNDPNSSAPIMMITANDGFINQSERYSTDNAGKSLQKYILLQRGELAYNHGASKLRPYGSCFALIDEENARIPYVYHCFSCGNENPEFLSLVLNSKAVEQQLRRLVSSGARMDGLLNISFDDYTSIPIMIPNRNEQKQIADYIHTLNGLITLHQRKYDMLQKVKKSMLEKMFPKNGSKVPEIRFAGFTDDWEQRKLGDVVQRITRKNENMESSLPLTISAQYGLIDQNEFFDKRIASKDVSDYYLVYRGEFAYNKSTSTDAPWGAIKRLDRYEKGVLSTLYIVFRIQNEEETDSDYLVSYYDTELWHNGVQAIAAEGARNHGLLNIAPNDFFETNLLMPESVNEQRMIGTFFKKLDHLITLHQRWWKWLHWVWCR